MSIIIEQGIKEDIDELAMLYDDLNDYLQKGTNYPGWLKGIYPIREDATEGIKSKGLYAAKEKGKIVGSFILSHKPESAYDKVNWKTDDDYSRILVVYTFVVHPAYLKKGLGKMMIDFIIQYGVENNMKSIRLDVYEKNIPAIKLYEKCGFSYVDTVDLGLSNHGLDWFKLYEKVLQK
ncbi:GNAT family N-acetyltransferase [Romboutsia weinsteinii]|uniref:GNAT family N-acetyltransferase n=1 Tax=Romboutsia weinsteinii TaxID=2020949 RepID=A0A371J3G6_9FIRM|nr:GNAT family N-acetyltransferase [Romboutsia weinsteinii]RDY27275.1 GNAT family N-acetyltransferase [Romboutsia weinsteinii]